MIYLLSWVSLPPYPSIKDFLHLIFCFLWVSACQVKGYLRFKRGQIRRVSVIIAAKFGYTLPQIKDLLNSCEMNVPQLPKIGSNFRESFGKVWMGKSRNYKNCVRHYQTALGAGVYYWKAAGSIIPQISWGRMDQDRGGWIYNKRPEQRSGQSNREEAYLFTDMHGVRLVLQLR